MTPDASSFPDRTSLEVYQLAQLRGLMGVLANNPFYSRKFQLAGVSGQFATLTEFAQQIPFTLKQELVDDQRANPPFGTNLSFPLERYTRFNQTSGTSGQPMRWLDTPETWDWMLDNWSIVYKAAGVSQGDRIFFAFSFGPFLGFWTAFESAARMGCMAIPGGGMRSVARLRAIIENGANVLCCTPTYAIRLTEVAAEEGIDLAQAKVKTIIVAGEPGGCIPVTRERIHGLWNGARLVDHHGMTEIGPVSYECPSRPGVLHVIGSAFIAEVIDTGSGLPVSPEGTGELVLTNLGRSGSPLLRYRTGDIVRKSPDHHCACGSTEASLDGGILGRTDDMVVVRGVNIYPSAIEEVLRGCPGLAEYRVEVDTSPALPELSIQVEPAPGQDASTLEAQVGAALNAAFALRVVVSSVPPGQLPRFEMKAQRWVKR